MRLIVHGRQTFGQAVLNAILERGDDDVVAVYCPPDEEGEVDSLKERALESGLPTYQPSTYKDPKVWDQVESHHADLCVMTNVTMFVPEEALYAPRFGSIQYHPSLLPVHRGKSPINWAIISGKTGTGLTVFWPDNGLDTGPILLQKHCSIGADTTSGELFREQLFPLGVSALLEAIDRVRTGTAPRVAQDIKAGSAETQCSRAHSEIDWTKPARSVYDLVRGCDPTPGAWGRIDGFELTVLGCELAGPVDARVGTLTEIDDAWLCVALDGGSLRVSRVQIDTAPAANVADAPGLAGLVGQRFERHSAY